MFFKMVYKYWQERRDDRQFVLSLLPTMEKELNFWLHNRSVLYTLASRHGEKKNVSVFHFDSQTTAPRPESYSIDTETAESTSSIFDKLTILPCKYIIYTGDKTILYRNIAAGAETGWDFTSRFLSDRKNLNKSITKDIWPVDLNAYMCENYRILAELYKVHGKLIHVLHACNLSFSKFIGDMQKASMYEEEFEKLREVMMTVFYNDTHGSWFDIDSQTSEHNTEFYASNLAPLYSGCYSFSEESAYDKIVDYFIVSLREFKILIVPEVMMFTELRCIWFPERNSS